MARLTPPPHALSLFLFLDDEGGGRDAECIFLTHNWLYLNSLTNNISVMQDASSSPCREGNTTGLNRATARALFQSLRASIPMSYHVRKGQVSCRIIFLATSNHFFLQLKSSPSSLRVGCSSFGSRASGRAPWTCPEKVKLYLSHCRITHVQQTLNCKPRFHLFCMKMKVSRNEDASDFGTHLYRPTFTCHCYGKILLGPKLLLPMGCVKLGN